MIVETGNICCLIIADASALNPENIWSMFYYHPCRNDEHEVHCYALARRVA